MHEDSPTPTYIYACSAEHQFEKILRISEFSTPQSCPTCGATGKQVIAAVSFVQQGDNWPGKAIKINGQMAQKNARLDVKQAARPVAKSIPNVDGEETATWADAKKLAASKKKNTASYDAKVQKEAMGSRS